MGVLDKGGGAASLLKTLLSKDAIAQKGKGMTCCCHDEFIIVCCSSWLFTQPVRSFFLVSSFHIDDGSKWNRFPPVIHGTRDYDFLPRICQESSLVLVIYLSVLFISCILNKAIGSLALQLYCSIVLSLHKIVDSVNDQAKNTMQDIYKKPVTKMKREELLGPILCVFLMLLSSFSFSWGVITSLMVLAMYYMVLYPREWLLDFMWNSDELLWVLYDWKYVLDNDEFYFVMASFEYLATSFHAIRFIAFSFTMFIVDGCKSLNKFCKEFENSTKKKSLPTVRATQKMKKLERILERDDGKMKPTGSILRARKNAFTRDLTRDFLCRRFTWTGKDLLDHLTDDQCCRVETNYIDSILHSIDLGGVENVRDIDSQLLRTVFDMVVQNYSTTEDDPAKAPVHTSRDSLHENFDVRMSDCMSSFQEEEIELMKSVFVEISYKYWQRMHHRQGFDDDLFERFQMIVFHLIVTSFCSLDPRRLIRELIRHNLSVSILQRLKFPGFSHELYRSVQKSMWLEHCKDSNGSDDHDDDVDDNDSGNNDSYVGFAELPTLVFIMLLLPLAYCFPWTATLLVFTCLEISMILFLTTWNKDEFNTEGCGLLPGSNGIEYIDSIVNSGSDASFSDGSFYEWSIADDTDIDVDWLDEVESFDWFGSCIVVFFLLALTNESPSSCRLRKIARLRTLLPPLAI